MSTTVRLTVGQALVRFLAHQHTERDGQTRRMFAGMFGIFGHGYVLGLGQGVLQAHHEARQAGVPVGEVGPDELPYILSRNEQAQVHAAVSYAEALAELFSLDPQAVDAVTRPVVTGGEDDA